MADEDEDIESTQESSTDTKKRKYAEGDSEETESEVNVKKQKKILADVKTQARSSALEELTSTIKKQQIRREEETKKKQERDARNTVQQKEMNLEDLKKDNWIVPGIIVKVLNKKVGNGEYYGKKGRVLEVIDLYVGVIQMLDSNHKLKVDQAHLETVIPSIGMEIAILNGEYRGEVGILEGVKIDKFKVVVRVNDNIVEKDYEDVCKISE